MAGGRGLYVWGALAIGAGGIVAGVIVGGVMEGEEPIEAIPGVAA